MLENYDTCTSKINITYLDTYKTEHMLVREKNENTVKEIMCLSMMAEVLHFIYPNGANLFEHIRQVISWYAEHICL